MVQQHVDHVPEAVWFLGREEAAADLVHGLLQLGQAVIVLSGIVPVERWGQTSGSGVREGVCTGHTSGPRPTLALGLPSHMHRWAPQRQRCARRAE